MTAISVRLAYANFLFDLRRQPEGVGQFETAIKEAQTANINLGGLSTLVKSTSTSVQEYAKSLEQSGRKDEADKIRQQLAQYSLPD